MPAAVLPAVPVQVLVPLLHRCLQSIKHLRGGLHGEIAGVWSQREAGLEPAMAVKRQLPAR